MLSPITMLHAQDSSEEVQYKRSSLAIINIKHPKYAYNKEIEFILSKSDKPDRFNDHTMKVKSVVFSNEDKDQTDNINRFIEQNKLGRRLVSKWFNHKKKTCDFHKPHVLQIMSNKITIFLINAFFHNSLLFKFNGTKLLLFPHTCK